MDVPIQNEQDGIERCLGAMLAVVDTFAGSLGALREAIKTPEGREQVDRDIDELRVILEGIRSDFHGWMMGRTSFPPTAGDRMRRMN